MNILIIEDEMAAAGRLEKLVKELEPNVQVLEVIDTVQDSVEWLQKNPSPDLIFMDIQLADGDSFEIFDQVAVEAPVVFITAYDEYAVRAFHLNSIDYLLKPLKKEELKGSLEKWRKLIGKKTEIDYAALADLLKERHHDQQKRFIIRFGQHIKVVDMNDISYFFTKEKSVFLTTKGGRTYTIDQSLDQLEHELDSSKFFRVNRQYIINVEAIDEMFAYSKSRVKIKMNPEADETIIVSTERSPLFKKWLEGEGS